MFCQSREWHKLIALLMLAGCLPWAGRQIKQWLLQRLHCCEGELPLSDQCHCSCTLYKATPHETSIPGVGGLGVQHLPITFGLQIERNRQSSVCATAHLKQLMRPGCRYQQS